MRDLLFGSSRGSGKGYSLDASSSIEEYGIADGGSVTVCYAQVEDDDCFDFGRLEFELLKSDSLAMLKSTTTFAVTMDD